MMGRRTFLGTLGLSVLALPLAAEAQQVGKAPRIGFLANYPPGAFPQLQEAFLQGLRDLGYVEGCSVVIEYRDAEGKFERLPALAAELLALKVDVIVAPTTAAALALKQATNTLPTVFAVPGDPVGSGLVTSLARPGGNVTGLSLLLPELVGKCLELLKQTDPGVSLVAVLWQPGGYPRRTEKEMLKGADVAGRYWGCGLIVEARGPADFDRAFSDMTRARAGALTVLGSTMFFNERRRLVELAAKNRLPAVYPQREFVDAGGLMSYGANLADSYRRAATYVDKILRGAKPADLPVEQPTKFELVINLKTAKALGLTIPPSLALAPRAFRVRVWQITSWGQGPRTGRALPEGIDVGYPPSLGKPILVMREKTERPEAAEAGTVKLVGTDVDRIYSEAVRLLDDDVEYARMSRIHNPYGDGRACGRMTDAIAAYFAGAEASAAAAGDSST
jgi:putative ABC transport system substrate-binding protein